MKKEVFKLVLIAAVVWGLFLFPAKFALAQTQEDCETPTCDKIIEFPDAWKNNLTLVGVAGGALVDAINPCAFAVFILLFANLLTAEGKKRALFGGLAFSLAVFLTYIAMGFGLLQILERFHISLAVLRFVGIFSIIFGLLNIKDYIGYGAWGFVMEVPQKWRPKMKSVVRSATTVWGAFTAGLIVSLFLLPCTSGPYVVILSLLAKQSSYLIKTGYILFYNVVFALPFVLITFAMYFGFSAIRAEELRKKKARLLHLIAGVIMVLLGIAILTGWL